LYNYVTVTLFDDLIVCYIRNRGSTLSFIRSYKSTSFYVNPIFWFNGCFSPNCSFFCWEPYTGIFCQCSLFNNLHISTGKQWIYRRKLYVDFDALFILICLIYPYMWESYFTRIKNKYSENSSKLWNMLYFSLQNCVFFRWWTLTTSTEKTNTSEWYVKEFNYLCIYGVTDTY
jgi:hypothetical protein